MLEALVRLFAPHICIGCGVEEDHLLCEGCAHSLVTVPSRCYRCKAVTTDYAVCRDCGPRTALRQVAVHTHYKDQAKQLVHRMKYERARAGIAEAAALSARLLSVFPSEAVLVHVPTATSRVRLRGYDQAQVLARELSCQGTLPHIPLLARRGQAHQVGANRTARLRQLDGAFRVRHPERVRGKYIVLVDDVLTTGATLEMAARCLRRAGARRVSAIVFAQA